MIIAETELSSPDNPVGPADDLLEEESERPYEKRALNFLVNEYLLLHNYKLSSVTFAEENENQVNLCYKKYIIYFLVLQSIGNV